MTTNTSLSSYYNHAVAEKGKFCEIDKTYLNTEFGYPLSGYGRYAVLTKIIDPIEVSNVSLSGATLEISDVLTVQSSGNLYTEEYPLSVQIASRSFTSLNPETITFSGTLKDLEIQNKTDDTIYFLPSATDSVDNLTSMGIEIDSDTFYNSSHRISNISMVTLSSGPVKILAYYY